MGRRLPGLGGESVPLVGVCGPTLLLIPPAPPHGDTGLGISNEARWISVEVGRSTGFNACGEAGTVATGAWWGLSPSK